MLRVTEREFKFLTLNRILRAMEWFNREDEARLVQTRLICFYQGNHKASTPEDLWSTEREIRKKQKDLIEGILPIASFKKLTPEEVQKWKMTVN